MRFRQIVSGLFVGLLCTTTASVLASERSVKPVTPNASPEAAEVLAKQPGWTWWMTWAGMGGGRRIGGAAGPNPTQTLVNDPRS